MAPMKNSKVLTTITSTHANTLATRSVMTRSAAVGFKPTKPLTNNPPAAIRQQARVKRKADGSPMKGLPTKRSALGDLTNYKAQPKNDDNKGKPLKKIITRLRQLEGHPKTATKAVSKANVENAVPPAAPVVSKVQTRATTKEQHTKAKTRLSEEFEKTSESLYTTAIDTTNSLTTSQYQITTRRSAAEAAKKESTCEASLNESTLETAKVKSNNVTLVAQQLEMQLNLGNHSVPEGVVDFDKEHWDDIYQVSHYTKDIFNYLKEKELENQIDDYMARQVHLTRGMRALLVDWMVEIQESFELNHETLYLGVKLADMYLSKVVVGKDALQLVGAASMFVASKYDERLPPLIDDFLYICDGAYTRCELTRMELSILKVCDYNLGVPISYRFLRRYARTAHVEMSILTLARYILEYSLMDYATVTIRDSILAAAALYLALKMKDIGTTWNATFQFYSGYNLPEIMSTVYLLNDILHRKPKDQLQTVRNKYSHKIFYEVAAVPLLRNNQLGEHI